jgi:hypothetical protein
MSHDLPLHLAMMLDGQCSALSLDRMLFTRFTDGFEEPAARDCGL